MSITRGQPYYAQVADALRAEIRSGRFAPGDQLPSERELRQRFGVGGTTVKAAIVQLRAEGLVVSHQGRGVFVAELAPLRRLDSDISTGDGFYNMLERAGVRPATITTVERRPANDQVAEALDVPSGTEVVIRHRLMRAEGGPPLCLATSYFPTWVTDAAPNLANPQISGMPVWLRNAFGDTYSEDLVDARAATEDEARQLEVEPGSPVVITKGLTRDQQERTLHFIIVVTASGRMPFHYRYGAIPSKPADPEPGRV